MGGDFFVVAMIFFVLRCAIETVTGSFFRYGTRDGANGANGRGGVYERNGRIWLIGSGLDRDEGLKLQEIGN